ncbi:Fe-S cluster assembly sulfur transfer protein SufU [Arenibaculum pallidiluteum]|uniref:Fe-S cluster assembly sulfur transfer protein SufU n=1 Tax=Arenibaculum pallidiluteum TaxID=2812559 RepID=UPI001A973D77|nr:SUF system NifU family Fe-S cluster assembly protein [Arenibaculum pallidiluteum]
MSDELRDLYQEVILDHGRHPRNHRHPEDPTHHARGDNPMCGDRVEVFLTLRDGVIADAAFEGRGCAISVASASMMTELVAGKTPEAAEALFRGFQALCTGADHTHLPDVDASDMERLEVMSGVRQFPMRVKCATLAWHTLSAAMAGADRASSETDGGKS